MCPMPELELLPPICDPCQGCGSSIEHMTVAVAAAAPAWCGSSSNPGHTEVAQSMGHGVLVWAPPQSMGHAAAV